MHTQHAWPSQMHVNLLISGVKTLAIARVLTLLINKFSCICEDQSWWVRIKPNMIVLLQNMNYTVEGHNEKSYGSLLQRENAIDTIFALLTSRG